MLLGKCLACGQSRDLEGEALYPYPDDNLDTTEPIPLLMTVECQSATDRADFRMAVMCHDCWHKLSSTIGIDMWIGQKCWESLTPVTLFARLPLVTKDGRGYAAWEASNYVNENGVK